MGQIVRTGGFFIMFVARMSAIPGYVLIEPDHISLLTTMQAFHQQVLQSVWYML